MKNTLLSITTLILTFIFTVPVAKAQTPESIAWTARAATVSLSMDNGKHGTGFFVTPDWIATSYGVIEGASSGFASEVIHEKNYPIEGIVAIEKYDDLVILKVQRTHGTYLPIGDSDAIKEHSIVYIVGNSDEEKGVITIGEIHELVDREELIRIAGVDPKKEILIKTESSLRDSGGPILDKEGDVIGIHKGMVSDKGNLDNNYNVAIPSKYLRSLLVKSTKESQRFLRPLSISGVVGVHLTWGQDSYEFTLSNQRDETIYDPYCLIIFKDRNGEVICADQFLYGGMMFAGRSSRVSRRAISKATDHSYYPYRPENKPTDSPGVLDVSLVGSSVKQHMRSYEIKVIDFDIDTMYPSRNTPLEGITGRELIWFEMSKYSEIYGIDALGMHPEQQPMGELPIDPNEIGFSYVIENELNKKMENVMISIGFYDKNGVQIDEWSILRTMDIGAMETFKVKGWVTRGTKKLTERVEPRIFPDPIRF